MFHLEVGRGYSASMYININECVVFCSHLYDVKHIQEAYMHLLINLLIILVWSEASMLRLSVICCLLTNSTFIGHNPTSLGIYLESKDVKIGECNGGGEIRELIQVSWSTNNTTYHYTQDIIFTFITK